MSGDNDFGEGCFNAILIELVCLGIVILAIVMANEYGVKLP